MGNTNFVSSNSQSPFMSASQGSGNYFNQQQNANINFGNKNVLFGGSTNNGGAVFSSLKQTGFLSNSNPTNSPFAFKQTNNNIFKQSQNQQSPFSQAQFPQQNQNQFSQNNNIIPQNAPLQQNAYPNQFYSNATKD